MGELSKKKREVLDFLLEGVTAEIYGIEQHETDLGKLDYSLCSDDDEKLIITQKKVDKLKKKISKCNPIIASYLNALTITDPFNLAFDEKLEQISENFVWTEYNELIEMLVDEDITKFRHYQFDSIVESLGFKYKLMKEFIRGVCDIKSFYVYKSLLDIPQNNNLDYDKIVEKLNNAFFKLEAFMNDSIKTYKHFDFNITFTELFYYSRKEENYTYDNCKRIGLYWGLTEQIRVDYDKSTFKNENAYNNKDFNTDCNVLTSISWDRINEFISFQTADQLKEHNKKISISEIINPTMQQTEMPLVELKEKGNQSIDEPNPYPRIFKDKTVYSLFERLVGEFGNTKENLSNYSFVFHKMTYAGLIHFDLLQKTYFDMLSEFDISIDRIKPKGEIGKVSLRESVYSRVKQTL